MPGNPDWLPGALLVAVFALFDGLAAWLVLKKDYPKEQRKIFLFFLSVGFVLPIVGTFLTFWVVVYLKRYVNQNIYLDSETVLMEPLYHNFVPSKRIFGEGALMLLHDDYISVDAKIKALKALRKDINRYRLNIIRQALSDREDEVRLFAFSIIDKLEKELNEKIHDLLTLFEKGDDETRLDAAKKLANLYWDMVYYELSDEVLQNFFVEEALRYAEYALKCDFTDMSMHILAGKIFIKRGEIELAEREFVTVLEIDPMKYSFIAPYLAEIFYNKSNFVTTRALLNINNELRYNLQLYPIVETWLGERK